MTTEQALELAYQHHRAGRLAEAEQFYRQVLAQRPDHAGALHMLGVLAGQTGHLDAAVALIERAIAVDPNEPLFHTNRAKLLMDKGQPIEAVAAARRAVAFGPGSALHHYNLANAFRAAGAFDEAQAQFRATLEIEPTHAGAHQNLLALLEAAGNRDAALRAGRDAARLLPDSALGRLLLANALQFDRQFDAAQAAYASVLERDPGNVQAINNLAYGYKEAGLVEKAVAAYRAILAAMPNAGSGISGAAAIHSNLLYALHFLPESTPQSLLTEHLAWDRLHAAPLKPHIRPHANIRDPNRRLRIGYVSPDFREHAVGRMIMPLLAHHDHAAFEIVCYSDTRHPDSLTAALRAHADQWHDTAALSDLQLAEVIRRHQVDILVDLTMHMAGNRLQTFALKPAPIQLSYLAYCSTTGLSTIDYRLSDPYLDPPTSANENDSCYTEKTVGLPETYWCYQPPDAAPTVNDLPAAATGRITFACLNNFCKVSNDTLTTWAALLDQTTFSDPAAASHLLLYVPLESARQRLRQCFADRNINPARIEFTGLLPAADYFRQYNHADIALDPFPYAGGTTTCDALFMGVPVITLAGKTAVGRGGVSILSNLNLPDLIAPTPEAYIHCAKTLAADLPRLASLRRTLRNRLRASPLMNAPRFAENIQALYRRLWHVYSTQPQNPPA